MLASTSDFSVPKIKHRIPETPKQSTKPVVHQLQSLRSYNSPAKAWGSQAVTRGGVLLSSCKCWVVQGTKCHLRVLPGQQGTAVPRAGTEGRTVTFLLLPPPCFPPTELQPLTASPQCCCWQWWDWGSQGLWGTARWLVWFHTWYVRRISNYLQLIRFMQHLDIFSQKDGSKLFYSLTCYLSGFCCSVYKTCEGQLETSKRWCWRVNSSSENSIRCVYECWFLCCFSQLEWLWLPLAEPAVCCQSQVTGNLQAARAQWQMGDRCVGGNEGTTTKSTAQKWEQGWVWSALTQTHSRTLVFLEQFLISECDGHRAFWEVAVGGKLRNIHRNEIILNT